MGFVHYAKTNKTAFVVYGDEGPPSQIGEGSVGLATSLGFDPFNSHHTKVGFLLFT